MSTKHDLEDWRWMSLFDPKTGHGFPPIEGGFQEDYRVEEEYVEAYEDDQDDEDNNNDDFNNHTEEANELPVFAGEDEDEE